MIDPNGCLLTPDAETVVWNFSDFSAGANGAAPSDAAYPERMTIVGDNLYFACVHYGFDGEGEGEDPNLTLVWNAGPVASPLYDAEDWTLVATLTGKAIVGRFVSDRTRVVIYDDYSGWEVLVGTGVGSLVTVPTDPELSWAHGQGEALDAHDANGLRYSLAEAPEGIRDIMTFAGTNLLDRPAIENEFTAFTHTAGFPGFIIGPDPQEKDTHSDLIVIRFEPSDVPPALVTYSLGVSSAEQGVINVNWQNTGPYDPPDPPFWTDATHRPTFTWVIDPTYAAELTEDGATYSIRLWAQNEGGGGGPVTVDEDSHEFFWGDDSPEDHITFGDLYRATYEGNPLSEDVPGMHFFPVITIQPATGPSGSIDHEDIDWTRFSAWISGQFTIEAINYDSSPYLFHSVNTTVGGDGIEDSTESADCAGATFVAGVDKVLRTDYHVINECWWTAQAAFNDKTDITGGLDIYSLAVHWEPDEAAPTSITGEIRYTRARFSGT